MNTKLTLRLERRLIERAKAYARKMGKSVSQIVAEYFAHLDAPAPDSVGELPPMVRSLRGILRGYEVGRDDDRQHVEEKHR